MGILRKSNRRNIKIPKLQSGKTLSPKMPKAPTVKKLVKVPKASTAVKAQASMPKIPAGQNRRSGLAGMLKTPAPAAKKSSQAKQPLMATPIEPNNVGKKKVKKGPGFKDGGLVAGAANRRRRMQEMVNK